MNKTDLKEVYLLPSKHSTILSLDFPRKNTHPTNGIVLAADVGGTKTNLALFESKDGQLKTLKANSYPTKEYSSFIKMVKFFHTNRLLLIDSICLGVAGPVVNGKVQGVNFPWSIDGDEIAKEFHVEHVAVMNDMEANAYGLAALDKEELFTLIEGSNASGNAVMISPGTGLGEVGMYWNGVNFNPFASEGGHCDFCPRNNLEIDLWKYMDQRYKHVSWERVLSGPGIYDVFQFLLKEGNEKVPEWIQEKMLKEDPSAVITQIAIKGQSAICRETLDLFTRFLAIEAAQLALKMKATGGIYIGGGIVPKIVQGMDLKVFKRGFIQSGRLDMLLETIPVKVVLNQKTALLGAAYYGAAMLN
ncbi:glucokinase [Lutibacter citreus]|uniref:glucokinase n=1 Tax=Lutibacter citreus TaxID=2138210 RepID=UPI000DBE9026|nr:glucokinase [Lutibacter citreus]